MKLVTSSILLTSILFSFTGCTQEQLNMTLDSITNVAKASKELNSEQEYYLGRTVSANILTRYSLNNNKQATSYINYIGNTLALNSNMPETFGGYHFAILDTNEVNAFAAPGGFIFVTRGMLKLCRSEDALAAVLAHEIGHIEHKHGINSIQKSRITSALSLIGKKVADEYGNEDLKEITDEFGDSINDIINTMVVKGYSRSSEYEADISAIRLLAKTGYSQNSMIGMLKEMDKRLKNDSAGFGSTHPTAKDRIDNLLPYVNNKNNKVTSYRNKRFNQYMGTL